MITKYLNLEGEAAVESVSTMAIMLGADPTVACESDEEAKKTGFNFKEKVKGIIAKIHSWLQKVVSWIKEKLFALLKVDAMKVDKDMWNDGNAVLGLCGKFEMGTLSKLAVICKSYSALIKENKEKLQKIKEEVTDESEKITSSEVYKRFMSNEYGGKDELTVKGSHFEDQKTKLNRTLTILQDNVKTYQDAINGPQEIEGLFAQVLLAMTNSCIKVTGIRLSVVNRFIMKAGVSAKNSVVAQ